MHAADKIKRRGKSTNSDSPPEYIFFVPCSKKTILGFFVRFCVDKTQETAFSPKKGGNPSNVRIIPKNISYLILEIFCKHRQECAGVTDNTNGLHGSAVHQFCDRRRIDVHTDGFHV